MTAAFQSNLYLNMSSQRYSALDVPDHSAWEMEEYGSDYL
jgi:hypothetical protein